MGALAFAVLLLAIGLVLLWNARGGFREGDTPHCAKCDYSLLGLTATRCPECGAELKPANVAHGERRRATEFIVLGLVCTVGPVLFLGKTLYDSARHDSFWFRVRSTSRLETLTKSPDWQSSEQAWQELQRRLESGSLDAARTGHVIDLALKALPKITVNPTTNWVNYSWPPSGNLPLKVVSSAVANRQASYSQTDKYLRHWILANLKVRSRVRQGDPVSYSVSTKDLMTGDGNMDFACRIEKISIFVDGTLQKSYTMSEEDSWRQPRVEGSLSCDQLGRHTLRAVAHSLFYMRKGGFERSDTPCHITDIPFDEPFDVLPSSADPVHLEPDASLQTQMHNIVQFSSLSHADGQMRGYLSLEQPPATIAMDIIVRIQGREYQAGAAVTTADDLWWGDPVHGDKPAKGFAITASCARPTDGKCDIILRSNPDRARETVDIYEMWDGELLFKDVPIEVKE